MKKWRLEINLIKVSQLISDRAGISIHIHLILKLFLIPGHTDKEVFTHTHFFGLLYTFKGLVALLVNHIQQIEMLIWSFNSEVRAPA